MTDLEIIDRIKNRRRIFDALMPPLPGANIRVDLPDSLPNTCPSCGYPTLTERCSWEICSVCFWEDDGQDDQEEKDVWGGPNGQYSLWDHRIETERLFAELMTDESDELGKRLKKLIEIEEKVSASTLTDFLQQLGAVMELFDQRRDIK